MLQEKRILTKLYYTIIIKNAIAEAKSMAKLSFQKYHSDVCHFD